MSNNRVWVAYTKREINWDVHVCELLEPGTSNRGNLVATVHGFKFGKNNSKRDANAHLIAAAPEMYEMLSDILRNYEAGTKIDLEIERLLAKARGEQ